MILRHLQLENFLSHRDEHVSLPAQGMFLLSGESGAGKSSLIIDATAYALFGAAAVTRAKRQAELITDRQKEMKVKAVFDLGGQALVVERGISDKGQPWARVYSGDQGQSKLLAEGPKAVSRELTSRLGGMTWQQFFAAFVARQDEISMLTSLRGAERKNLIHRMLGMRELEKSADILANRRRRVKSERQQIELSLGNFDPEAKQQEIDQLQQTVSAEQQRIKDLNQQLSDHQQSLTEAERTYQQLAEQAGSEEKRQQLVEQEKNLTAQLAQAEQQQQADQQAQEAEQRFPQVQQQVSEQQQLITELREEYLRVEDIERRQRELKSVEQGSESTDSVEQLTAQIARQQGEVERLKQDLQQGAEDLQRLEDDNSCYLCQRPFDSPDDHQHLLHNRQQAQQEQQQLLQQTEQQLAAAQKKLPAARQQQQAAQQQEQNRQAIEQLQAQRSKPGVGLDELKQLGSQAGQDVKKLQEELVSLEASRRQRLPDITDQVNNLREQLTACQQQLAALPEDIAVASDAQQRYQQAEKECQQLRQSIAVLQGQIPEAQTALQRSEQQLTALNTEMRGRNKEVQALENYKQQQETLERLTNYLQGFQNQLVAEIRPALEEIGSEMLITVSDGKYQRMIIDQDYEISVRNADGDERRAAILSGGEQIRVNLCLRLALTRLVSQRTGVPVGFLILDEPLPSQDPGHIERILDLLASLKPFYQQQFIISHVGNIRSATELDYVLEFFPERRPSIELAQA